ncbi:MAG TPA: peroxidase-related enzyme [Candidatus Izemoplasmatales bacterium]|nr:peroxidase-related enzyme [Candidatus Izemoplasmatales bacterium]
MSWIKELDKDQDTLLKKIYEDVENRTGKQTSNVLKVHSLKPQILKAHMSLYETLMFEKSQLSRTQREMIGVVVSSTNQCPYCVSHHEEALYHVSDNQDLMKLIAKDYRLASLDDKDLMICKYSEKLTKTPYKMYEDDVQKLRRLGFNDEAILDINQIVSYFNYVNRVVHGLGVVLE